MKTYLLLAALLASRTHATENEFMNFVHQIQLSSGVVWLMPVDPQGESPSKLQLEQGGALFQLWTIEQATAKDYLLDQKRVGAYLPSASITIKTLDPYSTIPRTRVDQPFTVTVNVAGLLPGEGLPDAASRVLLEHHLASYTSGQTSVAAAQAISGTPESSAFLANNGNTVLTFPATSLKAADPTQARGEEHFVVHALGDGSDSQTQLASAFVQVWPVASGSIAGISDGDRIRYNAPPLTVTLTDLYPRSNTWLQVYPGTAKLDTRGTPLDGSVLVLDQDRSDGRLLTVSDYDAILPEEGTYTLELVTQTPFGIDRLDHVTFVVDRKLEIRAQLSGIEGN